MQCRTGSGAQPGIGPHSPFRLAENVAHSLADFPLQRPYRHNNRDLIFRQQNLAGLYGRLTDGKQSGIRQQGSFYRAREFPLKCCGNLVHARLSRGEQFHLAQKA
jgi:hypothetical protein